MNLPIPVLFKYKFRIRLQEGDIPPRTFYESVTTTKSTQGASKELYDKYKQPFNDFSNNKVEIKFISREIVQRGF